MSGQDSQPLVEEATGSRPQPKKETHFGIGPGVVYPWVTFLIVTTLFVFAYHAYAWMVFMIVVVISCYAVIRMLQDWSRTKSWRSAGILILLAAVLSTLTGIFIYDFYLRRYHALAEYRRYDNVLPSEPADAHRDAGRLYFAEGTKADSLRSVGYKEVHTYCVAPIVSEATPGRVEYWAAGVDCCNARADMWCDDIGTGTHGGTRLFEGYEGIFGKSMGAVNHDYFLKAVDMASAEFDLQSDPNPIFVAWTRDPDALIGRYWMNAIGAWLVSLSIYILLAYALAVGLNQLSKATPDSKSKGLPR
mmetsp:Transcript_9571/g.21165  ORF Transcript_9571/g.21165 Transcript_9571/m.21165 type:complete len:304 (+) Transcript_9571:98-1009(+)